jgi:hypothetical protein
MNASLQIFNELLEGLQRCKTLTDCACGDGLYSISAANKGFKVFAFDARIDRTPRHKFKELNIEFRQKQIEDVIEISSDICLVSGIFYHLDLMQQLNFLGKLKSKVVILNTHIANQNAFNEFNLDGLYEFDKLEFAIYKEGNNRENRTKAALNNYFSCWHTEESLKNLFALYGYTNFEKQNIQVTENRFFYKIC